MKKIFLILLLSFSFTAFASGVNNVENFEFVLNKNFIEQELSYNDQGCMDFAIAVTEDVPDEDLTESINEWYAACWCWFNDSSACEDQ